MSNVKDKELQKSDDLSRAVQNFLSSKEFWIFFEHPLYLHALPCQNYVKRYIKICYTFKCMTIKKNYYVIRYYVFFLNLFRVLLYVINYNIWFENYIVAF